MNFRMLMLCVCVFECFVVGLRLACGSVVGMCVCLSACAGAQVVSGARSLGPIDTPL